MKQKEQHMSEERLLDALNDPENLNGEEWEELLSDSRNTEDIQLLEDSRQAFIRHHPSLQPNVRQEWAHFRQRQSKPQRRRSLWTGIGIGVAASLLLFLGWQWLLQPKETIPVPDGVMVFAANEKEETITLSTAKGGKWDLTKAREDSTLREEGVAWEGEHISYTSKEAVPEMHTLRTPRCTDYHFVLADGTEVWLNAESSLTYPNRFPTEKREVTLEGEAFFKVARDEARPFIVKANGIITEVLGTEFNVRTYEREDAHVTLLEGSVKVKSREDAEGVIIRPGEDARRRSDGTFEVKEVDTDAYYLWTEGYFYFDNEPLVEIARELGRWYNVDVEFRNPQAMSLRLHFLAEREQSVTEVLELLNLMGKVTATFSGNKIVIE